LSMSLRNELTNSPKVSHLPWLKKKQIIPNAVLPLPDKNKHVRSPALFRPNIICPKNTTDSPMCKEMLAYGKFVDMADQGHFSKDEIIALDEHHRKKMDQCKKDEYVMNFGTKLSAGHEGVNVLNYSTRKEEGRRSEADAAALNGAHNEAECVRNLADVCSCIASKHGPELTYEEIQPKIATVDLHPYLQDIDSALRKLGVQNPVGMPQKSEEQLESERLLLEEYAKRMIFPSQQAANERFCRDHNVPLEVMYSYAMNSIRLRVER
jgi:hypothetical protein